MQTLGEKIGNRIFPKDSGAENWNRGLKKTPPTEFSLGGHFLKVLKKKQRPRNGHFDAWKLNKKTFRHQKKGL